MTTKEQERQAIEEIRKIVEGLGENSYVGFAMEGVLELAEDNIREDTAYSMKKNAEIAWERADKAEKESKLLNAELGTAKKITEENNKVIAKLKADIYKLKATNVHTDRTGPAWNRDWHECPVCRQMVHLNSLPSKEFEIVDTGEAWQEQIKRVAEEGNSWQ